MPTPQWLGLDLFERVPRSLISGGLSLALAWGLLLLVDLQMQTWVAVLALAHGLFVGWSWEKIVNPEEFQLGGRLE